MGRFRQGFALAGKSWQTLKEHRNLSAFVIYGALSGLALMLITLVPGFLLIDGNDQTVPGAILVAIGLYLAAFAGYYFAVALAANADAIFRGESPSIADGLAVSRSRVGAIAGWALLATVVGTIISAIQNSGSIGEIVAGFILNIAWSLISFLAVPVIAFEGTGPFATVKRSASLFRERWGGQVAGNAAIGLATFLLGVLPGILVTAGGVYLWQDGNGAGIVVAVVGVAIILVASVIARALSGIFGVALYRFAAEGHAAGNFTDGDMESAVRVKR